MPPRRRAPEEPVPIDLTSALRGLLALAAAQRDDPQTPADQRRKTEVILHDAGCSSQQIAVLTGKSYAAVVKALQRSRKEGT